MARAAKSKVCPDCGTRNKASWDFCVRCGETLVDAAVTGAPAATPAAPSEATDSGGMLGLLAAVVIGVAALAFGSRLSMPTTEVDAEVYTVPTTVPPPPPFSIEPEPGQEEFWEGRAALLEGDASGSLDALAAAVAERPDDADAHYVYAFALFRTGSTAEAAAEFAQAAQLAPQVFRYQVDYGRALLATGDTAGAIQAYEAAVSLRAESPGALRELAIALVDLGEMDAAIAALEQAGSQVADSAILQQDLGGVLEKAGRNEDAAAAYRRALEINPGVTIARSRLSHLLFAKGDKEAAIQLAREGIAHDPSQASPYRDLGSMLERSGKPKEAALAYLQYAQRAPGARDAISLEARARFLDPKAALPPAGGPPPGQVAS